MPLIIVPSRTSNAAEDERPEPESTFEVVYASKPPTSQPSSRILVHMPRSSAAEWPSSPSLRSGSFTSTTSGLYPSLCTQAVESSRLAATAMASRLTPAASTRPRW